MVECIHGQVSGNNEGVEAEAGNDADLILEFWTACDCCDNLMHKSTPYQICKDGRTLCYPCRNPEEPETYPFEGWNS